MRRQTTLPLATTVPWAAVLAFVACLEPHAAWAHPDESSASLRATGDGAPRWYGWQIVTTDAIGAATLLAVIPTEAPGLAAVSLPIFGLGGPIVHAAHGNWGRAAGSLALRLGGFFAGGAIGVASVNDGRGDDLGVGGLGAALVGASLGTLGAMIVDWAVLSWSTDSSTGPAEQPPQRFMTPVVAATPSGMTFGVNGRF